MPKISGLTSAPTVTTADTIPVVQGGVTKVATLAAVASSPTMISSNTDATTMAVTDTFTILQGGVVKEASLSLLPAWNSSASIVASSSGTLTSATGVIRWIQFGKTVFFQGAFTITTNGTGAGAITATLPVVASTTLTGANQTCNGRADAISGKTLSCRIQGTTVGIWNYDLTYPASNGERLVVGGVYEAA